MFFPTYIVPEDWGTVQILNTTDERPLQLTDSVYTIECIVTTRAVPGIEFEANPTVVWLGPDGQEITGYDHNIIAEDSVIFKTYVSSKLIFSYLNTSHNGIYSCKASLDILGLNL